MAGLAYQARGLSSLVATPRRRLGWTVALVLVISLNVLLVMRGMPSDDGLTLAEREAMRSAEARVGSMLTFSHADLETDLAVAGANATGDFRGDYEDLLRSEVTQVAEKRKVVTRSEVTSAGIVGSGGDEVRLLVNVRSSTTVGDDEQEERNGSFEVSLRSEGGQWLVSDLRPL